MSTQYVYGFTYEAKLSMRIARDNARLFGRSVAGAEDLLFGAMSYEAPERSSKIADVMEKAFDVTPQDVQLAIQAISMRPVVRYAPDDHFTAGAYKALELAELRAGEAKATRFDIVVGLVRSEDVILFHMLGSLNVDPQRLSLVMGNSLAWSQ